MALSRAQPKPRRSRPSVVPGFGPTLGYTLFYISLIVVIPLAALFLRPLDLGWGGFVEVITNSRVVASLRLSFGGALIAAGANAVFGLLVAWVLVRYEFPGRRVVDAIVDLPFALPTAVAGIALTSLYTTNGWIGSLLEPLGMKVAFTPTGVVVAMIFIGLPFVVRTLEPVLQDFEADAEDAAASLGATRWQTFARVIFPGIFPALTTGFALAFARAVGEYGSIIFIAGNIPAVSEIAPLLIVTKLEQYDYAGATAIAVVMLLAAFALLLLINGLQKWQRSRLA